MDPEVTAEDQKLLTRRYTEQAVDFIRRNRNKPFFVYLAHAMVHVPLFCSADFEGKTGSRTFRGCHGRSRLVCGPDFADHPSTGTGEANLR